jgi:hypothetical protein
VAPPESQRSDGVPDGYRAMTVKRSKVIVILKGSRIGVLEPEQSRG